MHVLAVASWEAPDGPVSADLSSSPEGKERDCLPIAKRDTPHGQEVQISRKENVKSHSKKQQNSSALGLGVGSL